MVEKMLRAASHDIMNALPGWIILVDAELNVRFADRSYLDFLGLTLADVSGEYLEHVLLPGLSPGPDEMSSVLLAATRELNDPPPTIHYRTESGEERAVDLQVTPLDIAGEKHYLLVLHDVSEHWKARRKLEEIVNGMGASLAVLDRDLRVTWANKTFNDWFGATWGERFDYALRGLFLVGDTDPDRIFTPGEHISKEWAHYTARGDKRYYRNLILPTHTPTGLLKELILITQDFTEVTLRAEQHRLLRELVNLVQSTLELDRLLYIILTCSTAGHALGFNRAFIFLLDEETRVLSGRMGVGPASQEEAFTIWADLAGSRKSLRDLTSDFEEFRSVKTQPLSQLIKGLHFPLEDAHSDREILARTVLEDCAQLVRDSEADHRVTPDFRNLFGTREFVSVPLRAKGRVVGVLVADNVYSSRPISSEQLDMLELFAAHAGLAVDNARTYAELKLSMERVKEAQALVIQSDRLATVGRLAAHVAHEIRNPLVTIGGFARTILKDPRNSDRASKSAEIIFQEVQRLESILSGVMDFTRPAKLVPVVSSVNESIEKLLSNMEDELEESGITLFKDLRPDLPRCPFDESQLHQVLLNLIRNAIEVMNLPEQGVAPKRIDIRTRAEPDRLVVEVADTGPGITPDLLPSLFQPFVSRKTGGTGLGLAVVQKILLDHGGKVRVTNNPGRGARFSLTLPLASAEESPKRE